MAAKQKTKKATKQKVEKATWLSSLLGTPRTRKMEGVEDKDEEAQKDRDEVEYRRSDEYRLAKDLNKKGEKNIVIVLFLRSEVISTTQINDDLWHALRRCGSSNQNLLFDSADKGTSNIHTKKGMYYYLLVGTPGCGTARGFESAAARRHGPEYGFDVSIEINYKLVSGWHLLRDGLHERSVRHMNKRSLILSQLEKSSHNERHTYRETYQKQMPSYVRLCMYEYKSLVALDSNDRAEWRDHESLWLLWYKYMRRFILFLLVITGLGHIITSIGRKIWYITFYKVFHFLLCCCGIWTDESVMVFDLKAHLKSSSLAWTGKYSLLLIVSLIYTCIITDIY